MHPKAPKYMYYFISSKKSLRDISRLIDLVCKTDVDWDPFFFMHQCNGKQALSNFSTISKDKWCQKCKSCNLNLKLEQQHYFLLYLCDFQFFFQALVLDQNSLIFQIALICFSKFSTYNLQTNLEKGLSKVHLKIDCNANCEHQWVITV